MKGFVPFILASIAAFLVYLVLSIGSAGETDSVLLWSLPELIVGVILSIITGLLCRRLWTGKRYAMANPLRWLLLAVYIIPFVIELLIANLTVAGKILTGKNIRPGIVKLTPGLKTSAGVLLLSASITFQPGTATVDVSDTTGELYVHVLDTGDNPIKTMEPGKIFAKLDLAEWIRRITE